MCGFQGGSELPLQPFLQGRGSEHGVIVMLPARGSTHPCGVAPGLSKQPILYSKRSLLPVS